MIWGSFVVRALVIVALTIVVLIVMNRIDGPAHWWVLGTFFVVAGSAIWYKRRKRR